MMNAALSMKASMERNIRLSTLMHVLGQFQCHQPVFVLFYTLSKGFTMSQFLLCISAHFFVSLLAEIPTGSYSDRVSRKGALIIAWLIGTPVGLAMLLTDSFWVMFAANAISGIGAAFASGTDGALLFDSLKSVGREEEHKVVSGKMRWYGSLSMGAAALIGGVCAQLDVTYAWWLRYIVATATIFVVLAFREPPIERDDSEKKESFKAHVKESFRMGLRGKAGFFVWYAVGVWFFFSVGFWFWQPYLTLIGLPILWFGALYAALSVIGGFASRHAQWLEDGIGMRRSLLLIPLLLVLAFVLESQFVFLLGFCFLAIQSIASGFFGTLLDDYIHKAITQSKRRATIASLRSMFNSLFFSALSPLLGYHADIFSLQTTLLLMAGMLTAVTLILWFFFPPEPSRKAS